MGYIFLHEKKYLKLYFYIKETVHPKMKILSRTGMGVLEADREHGHAGHDGKHPGRYYRQQGSEDPRRCP